MNRDAPPGETFAAALRHLLEQRCGAPVELVETHISWVFLTPRLAFKLKKAVHLSFVDFRALAARRHFCTEELRLNRRMAPALYLGMLAVTGRSDAPSLGPGDAIDYLVCMRRFDEAGLLGRQLDIGRVDVGALDRFGEVLAAFHRQAPRADVASGFGSPERIRIALDAVLVNLAGSGGQVEAVRAWLAASSSALRDAWRNRRLAGAVRECHGDLHADNIATIAGELVAFDCIEFDPALRWIDTMSDTAFLVMDLKAHGRADLAHRFLDAYLQHSGDYAGVGVLRGYEIYRALVRALVARLRAPLPGGGAAPDYLGLASSLAGAPRAGPRLLVTHGLSGSGKSTLAAALLERAGAIRVRSDVERKRLFGLAPLARSNAGHSDIYGQDAHRRTFERLAECARDALRAGYPVIVDAAFLRRGERDDFHALASAMGVPFSILHCHAPHHRLRERVSARERSGKDASEAGLAVLEMQRASHDPLAGDERAMALEVETDRPVDLASLVDSWLGVDGPAPPRQHEDHISGRSVSGSDSLPAARG